MTDENEAKQDEIGEANSQTAIDANPDAGRDEAGEGTSSDSGMPSPEEWAEYKKKLDQVPNLVKGMNEAQERAALLERERDLYQRQAQAAAGVVQQTMDPRVAAKKRYLDRISQTYDESERVDAMDDYNRDILNIEKRSWLTEAEQRSQLLGQMPQAATMLGVDQHRAQQKLAEVYNTLTPQDLANVELIRSGNYDNYREAEKKRREEQARQADLLRSHGIGGGNRVPGSGQPGGASKYCAWEDWALLNDEEKLRIAESDEQVEIRGAPTHYDPAAEIRSIKQRKRK